MSQKFGRNCWASGSAYVANIRDRSTHRFTYPIIVEQAFVAGTKAYEDQCGVLWSSLLDLTGPVNLHENLARL